MTTPEQRQDVAQARAHADLARLRFSTALGNVRQRISPGRLKDDALTAVGEKVESAKLQARMSIRSHPVLMASARERIRRLAVLETRAHNAALRRAAGADRVAQSQAMEREQ
ncbi:hypothetical protein [Sphingobium lignivorans]|uniref:Mobilization protein n=1 Tax=Sphingobium lignivorans TaxID=2735886 RepID=A0ABR6NIG8_9SPHN|nr:hypothetical protein [Sphingobium lignivorans]MBB5986318.1 hypothetical protein [Sphingobium lignivorans]